MYLMTKYKLLIVWNGIEPEFNPNTYDDWDKFVAHAKRVKEMEGPDHDLFYVEWDPSKWDVCDPIETLKVLSFPSSVFEG